MINSGGPHLGSKIEGSDRAQKPRPEPQTKQSDQQVHRPVLVPIKLAGGPTSDSESIESPSKLKKSASAPV